MFTELLTRGSASSEWAGKNMSMYPSKMLEKILHMESVDRLVSQTMLKWRSSRGLTSLRPPPGGAQADTQMKSCTLLKNSFCTS